MRLPWLMEEILDWWDKTKARPQFKAEYVITHNIRASLEAAARAAAARLKMSPADTEALVKHYLGFPYPQTGAGAKPVPPVLFCIAKDSRDHSPEVYREVVLPMFATIDSGAEGARRAMGRRRAHLSEGGGRPAARHRAAGDRALRAGDPGRLFPGATIVGWAKSPIALWKVGTARARFCPPSNAVARP